jgi:hypothetical protein
MEDGCETEMGKAGIWKRKAKQWEMRIWNSENQETNRSREGECGKLETRAGAEEEGNVELGKAGTKAGQGRENVEIRESGTEGGVFGISVSCDGVAYPSTRN